MQAEILKSLTRLLKKYDLESYEVSQPAREVPTRFGVELAPGENIYITLYLRLKGEENEKKS